MKRFSYSIAYEKYYNLLEKERIFLKENGMSDEDISTILEFTKKQFNADCVYNYHNIAMSTYRNNFIDDGRNSFKKIKKGKPKLKEKVDISWINNVNNINLHNYLMKLSIEELVILTEVAINNTPKTVVASRLGITRQTVLSTYNRIIDNLRKYMATFDMY